MRSYILKQVIAYCVISSLITVVVGFIFVETAYWPIRKTVKSWVFPKESKQEYPRMLIREKKREILKLFRDLKIRKRSMTFLGFNILKTPVDLWVMQHIMFDTQPDYVIEAGTFLGGSALYWAHILDGLGLEDSKVITIDIKDLTQPISKHPLWQKYVKFIHSSSTSPETVAQITDMVKGKKVLVVLDSNHQMHHVLDELRLYGPLVSPGSYIVVEDTNIDGVPILPKFGPGPMAAVIKYLEEEGGEMFEQDVTREGFIIAQNNTGGWLKRKIQ